MSGYLLNANNTKGGDFSPPLCELRTDKIVIYNLFNTLPNIVHPLHPFQLVFGLELFCDALTGGVLFHQQIKHFVGCPVDLLQVGVQFAAEEQAGVKAIMVLPQVVAAAKPPDADAGAFRREQVGEQIVSLLMIAEIQHGVCPPIMFYFKWHADRPEYGFDP